MDNLFLFLNNAIETSVKNSIDTKTETETDMDTSSDVKTETEKDIINEPIAIAKEKKKYDQSKYNKNFMEKNKDIINQKKICDICCGSYSYYNKSKHMKSLKHLNLLNKQNQK